jgi:hypothetical protein
MPGVSRTEDIARFLEDLARSVRAGHVRLLEVDLKRRTEEISTCFGPVHYADTGGRHLRLEYQIEPGRSTQADTIEGEVIKARGHIGEGL